MTEQSIESATTPNGKGDPVPEFKVVPFEVALPGLASGFSQRLHAAGVPVTPWKSEQFSRSLLLTKPVSRRRLYCAARAIFVTGFQQVSRSTASSPRSSARAPSPMPTSRSS